MTLNLTVWAFYCVLDYDVLDRWITYVKFRLEMKYRWTFTSRQLQDKSSLRRLRQTTSYTCYLQKLRLLLSNIVLDQVLSQSVSTYVSSLLSGSDEMWPQYSVETHQLQKQLLWVLRLTPYLTRSNQTISVLKVSIHVSSSVFYFQSQIYLRDSSVQDDGVMIRS